MSIRVAGRGLVFSCLLLTSCRGAGAARSSPVERGRYLVDHLYACGSCHTPKLPSGAPDPARYLAGVQCRFDVDPAPGRGCINSKNLTHHPRGLANVTDDRAVKAMFLDGRRPDGKLLHPAMPAYEFHNMPAEHADAIVAYLRTVPGVDQLVPPSEPPFDLSPEQATPPLDLALVPEVPPSARDAESARRGRILVAAACVGCHTPSPARRIPGALPLDTSRLFAGGRAFDPAIIGFDGSGLPARIYSQNLTQHESGLLGWSADDVVRVLVEGKDRDGKGVCPPMPAGPDGPFHGLSPEDARNIASYVVTLPGIDNALPNACAVEPR
jgi:mono/diheme cytochrome c family protein